MNFVDLAVFKSVVDEGGVTKAARKLHRVPSGVTTRIKQLETSLGVTLFHRDRQRLHLSPTGQLPSGSSSCPMKRALLSQAGCRRVR